jgi:putative MATE family efflux protein
MQTDNANLQLMRHEKIPKLLLRLGVPTMIGLLVTSLYNLVDTYFVGGLGTSQMAAVSIAFPIVLIAAGLGQMFGSGAASYISRLLGEDKQERADKTASTALFTSLIVGMVFIILTFCFLDELLILLGATATILPYARDYGRIFIAGSIFSIFNVTVNQTISSEGAARVTMTAMLIGGCLNVVLDPIFIYILGYGVQGAAVATVISQAFTCLIYLRYLISRKGALRFSIHNFAPDRGMYLEIFKMGTPLLIIQLLTSVSTAITNTAAGGYSDAAVAAMGVVMRIITVGQGIVFGFIRGFQPIAGFNYGAKLYDRVREALRTVLKWSIEFCGIFAVLMIILAPQIISAFSADASVIDIGSKALRVNAISFLFFGYQTAYTVLFLAIGKARQGSLLSISRQGILFIPLILILPHFFGINGVIVTQPIADLLAVILTATLAIHINKHLKAVIQTD